MYIDRRRVDSLKQRSACAKDLVEAERRLSNELQELSYAADILAGCRVMKHRRKKRGFAYTTCAAVCRFRRHDYMLESYYKRGLPIPRSKGHDYNTRFKIPDDQSSADSLQRRDEYVKNLVHQDLASPEWLTRNCVAGSSMDLRGYRRGELLKIQNTARLKRRQMRKKQTKQRCDDALSYDRRHTTLRDIDTCQETPPVKSGDRPITKLY
jgi:hypothetical protein